MSSSSLKKRKACFAEEEFNLMPASKKRFRACMCCYARHSRCDGDPDLDTSCSNCTRRGLECTFTKQTLKWQPIYQGPKVRKRQSRTNIDMMAYMLTKSSTSSPRTSEESNVDATIMRNALEPANFVNSTESILSIPDDAQAWLEFFESSTLGIEELESFSQCDSLLAGENLEGIYNCSVYHSGGNDKSTNGATVRDLSSDYGGCDTTFSSAEFFGDPFFGHDIFQDQQGTWNTFGDSPTNCDAVKVTIGRGLFDNQQETWNVANGDIPSNSSPPESDRNTNNLTPAVSIPDSSCRIEELLSTVDNIKRILDNNHISAQNSAPTVDIIIGGLKTIANTLAASSGNLY